MGLEIERDYGRFRSIVKGQIRKELRQYMGQSHIFGKRGEDIVSIPLRKIDLPHFQFDFRQNKGVGQGEGSLGSVLGGSKAGNHPGEHILEVEFTLDELAEILGEELELPNVMPKGQKEDLWEDRERYSSLRKTGPESLRHFKRSFKEALKRQLASGVYNFEDPIIVPEREDRRYKSWQAIPKKQNTAVIIYMMDVSGSMTDFQKEIVRTEAFWIDTWIRSQYSSIDSRYIIHDAKAKEVDIHSFYHTRESGGTRISSAYQICLDMINRDYSTEYWNIYPFHFSDGDNWSKEDDNNCGKILEQGLLKKSNVFCYGQVLGAYGVGNFKRFLDEKFQKEEKLITSEIEDKDAIYRSIKEFLGKGK